MIFFKWNIAGKYIIRGEGDILHFLQHSQLFRQNFCNPHQACSFIFITFIIIIILNMIKIAPFCHLISRHQYNSHLEQNNFLLDSIISYSSIQIKFEA